MTKWPVQKQTHRPAQNNQISNGELDNLIQAFTKKAMDMCCDMVSEPIVMSILYDETIASDVVAWWYPHVRKTAWHRVVSGRYPVNAVEAAVDVNIQLWNGTNFVVYTIFEHILQLLVYVNECLWSGYWIGKKHVRDVQVVNT